MVSTKKPANQNNTSSTGVEQKVGYHHGNLSKALLDGALRLLEEGGIDAVTTRACAASAGVSAGAIRNHFPDKKALLAGLAANGYERLARRRQNQAVTTGGLKDALEMIIGNYVAFAVENSALFRLMFAEENLKRGEFLNLHHASHEGYAQLYEIIETAFRHDGLQIKDLNANIYLIWSAMHGIAMLVIDRQFGEEAMRALPVEIRCKQLAAVLSEGLTRTQADRLKVAEPLRQADERAIRSV